VEYYNNWLESEFNGIGVSCDKYFDKMFLQRVFYNQKLYDYEIDYVLKKTFDDLDNVKSFEKFESLIVFLESERNPNYKICEPLLDKIQERYKDKKIICVHQDWRIEDTKYIKIPTIRMLGEAINGCGTRLDGNNPLGMSKSLHEQNNQVQRQKLFLCGNRFRRFHRDELINFLRENNLEKKGLISILWEGKTLEDSCPNLELSDNPMQTFYNNVFCEISTESMHQRLVGRGVGHYTSEKIWKPFIYKVIPMIVTWPDSDLVLRKLNLDLFDDIIDTSFYQEDDLNKKFEIIKSNLSIIENECVEDKRFKDSIWERLNKNYQKVMDYGNIKNYIKSFNK
jgi:hypothetical protein